MDIDNLIKRYNEGVSLRKLEVELGHTRKYLSKVLKEHGVTIKTTNPNGVHINSKYTYNADVFKSLACEESAYWLGLLSADGYMSKEGCFVLELAEKDKDHVYKLANYLSKDKQPNRRVVKYSYKGVTKNLISYRLVIHCKEIYDTLISKGLRFRKYEGVSIPEEITNSGMLSHFLRGYFDGDGTISYKFKGDWHKRHAYLQFVGDKALMLQIQKILHTEVGTSITKLKHHGKAYGIYYGGNYNVTKICKYLYKDATLYLQRKYDSYQAVVKQVAQLHGNE